MADVWAKLVDLLKRCGLELRSPFHWVAGVVSALAVKVHPALSAISAALFVVYQVLQDKASASKDILEFLVAYFITVGAMLLNKLRGK